MEFYGIKKLLINWNIEILIIEESKNLNKSYIYSTKLNDFYKSIYNNSELKILKQKKKFCKQTFLLIICQLFLFMKYIFINLFF